MFKKDFKYYSKHPNRYCKYIEKKFGFQLFDYQKEYIKVLLEQARKYDVVTISYPRWSGRTLMYSIIDDMNKLIKL